jgi:hypothetical protein
VPAISSPNNTNTNGLLGQPSISVDGFQNASQTQNSNSPGMSGMRSASHPPEYPQRREEEQIGAEIATKVLGRNDKAGGQAPFYTGLFSARGLFGI